MVKRDDIVSSGMLTYFSVPFDSKNVLVGFAKERECDNVLDHLKIEQSKKMIKKLEEDVRYSCYLADMMNMRLVVLMTPYNTQSTDIYLYDPNPRRRSKY